MGWFGRKRQLDYALSLAGADRDSDGKFLITGGVFVGVGGEEVVVDDEARYFAAGAPRAISALLNSTSYGTRNVAVIARDTSPQ